MRYQIRVKGHLRPEYANWFDAFELSHTPEGDTLLTGPCIDQAALYGLVLKCRDLGLTLIALNPVVAEPVQGDSHDNHSRRSCQGN